LWPLSFRLLPLFLPLPFRHQLPFRLCRRLLLLHWPLSFLRLLLRQALQNHQYRRLLFPRQHHRQECHHRLLLCFRLLRLRLLLQFRQFPNQPHR
jgi:hypothetical protein